jgi:hypothetical protein
MAGSSRCGTTSQDGAGDIFDPLARWRRFGQGGSSVRTSNHGGGLRLVLVSGGWGTSSGYLDDNSRDDSRAWSRVAGLRSPRTRERRAEWQVGGPRARESCFGFVVLQAARRLVSVQHHHGVGSCRAVALSVWWCLPLCYSFSGGPLSDGSLLA